MDSQRYSELLQIPCYMFDFSSALRPNSFMDIAQEVAARGADAIGFGDSNLRKHNLVWILARMSVRFEAVPHRYDTVTAQTWHRGGDGVFFFRDSCLLNADNSIAVASTSNWVLMDIARRTVVRLSNLPSDLIADTQCSDRIFGEDCAKIVAPSNMELSRIGEHRVCYSDLDYNGHTNNTRYLVWALDVLPFKELVSRGVKEFSINFNKETHLGDVVELYHACENGVHYIEGRTSGIQNFILKISFA